MSLRQAEWSGGAIGIGFNHIFDYGLSLGIGVLANPAVQIDPEVKITYDVEVLDADHKSLVKRVKDDFMITTPTFGYFAIGYNF